MFDVLENRFLNNSRENTFVYLYSHKGAASYTDLMGSENFEGTGHMDDLLSIFPLHKGSEFYSAIPSKEDKEVSQLMVTLWTNFAKTGYEYLKIK
jgi:carboxylesterase type B